MMKRKPPSKKPMAKKPAPVRIDGEHAKVREITKRGHPLRGRIERRLGFAFAPLAKYNLAHTLAHLFFPENFAEPVAVGTGFGGEAMRKTYFAKVNLDAASREAIGGYYDYRAYRKEFGEKYSAHASRVEQVDFAPFGATGIIPNNLPMNVGFRGNRPVFFEIRKINIKKAEEHARKNFRGLRRKQALSIVRELKRHIPEKEWGGFVGAHHR